MSLWDLLLKDCKEFQTKSKETLYYKRMDKGFLFCYEAKKERYGDVNLRLYLVPPERVEVLVLKNLGVWDGLDEKTKNRVINSNEERDIQEELENLNKPEPKRTRVMNRFRNLPEVLVCSKCSKEQKPNYYQFQKKAEKEGSTVEELVKNFKCQKCNPTKGRGRVAKDYGDVPTQMVCKCGHVQKYPQAMIISMSEKKKIPIEKMIKNYQCQKCHPTKGRHKRVAQ